MKRLVYTVENWLDFLRLTDGELLKFCKTDVFKATGRGGQKKNKTSNAIRLTFFHLVVSESQSRSKTENVNKALKKLRLAIATDPKHAKDPIDTLPQPPKEIIQYLNTSEIHINPKNSVFPFFLGYFFICFIKNKGSWRSVGKELGFTPSQLRKFVCKQGNLKQMLDRIQSEWKATLVLQSDFVDS
jgi:hypothetical protein